MGLSNNDEPPYVPLFSSKSFSHLLNKPGRKDVGRDNADGRKEEQLLRKFLINAIIRYKLGRIELVNGVAFFINKLR
jgi:hypothetical protein